MVIAIDISMKPNRFEFIFRLHFLSISGLISHINISLSPVRFHELSFNMNPNRLKPGVFVSGPLPLVLMIAVTENMLVVD